MHDSRASGPRSQGDTKTCPLRSSVVYRYTSKSPTIDKMRMTRQAWGKTDDKGFHPLAHHCMDVAAVFARMLEVPVIRNRVETAAGQPLTAVECERLTALAFLHDIGKLHPGFQAKGWPEGLWHGPKRGHLKEGLEFLMLAYQYDKHPFHRTILQFLRWGDAVESLLKVMLAHHGKPVSQPSDPTGRDWKTLPHYDWQAEAHKMDEALHCWFAPRLRVRFGIATRQSSFSSRHCGVRCPCGLDRSDRIVDSLSSWNPLISHIKKKRVRMRNGPWKCLVLIRALLINSLPQSFLI